MPFSFLIDFNAMQNGSFSPELDLAIVGAGFSGLYSGWRWLTSPTGRGTRSTVFECSDRVGGRLLTVQPPGMPEARVELGGMRFTSEQKLVQALIADMQLETEPFKVSEPGNVAYLRGRHLKTADLVHPERVPYDIPEKDYEGFQCGFTALAAKRFLGKVLKTSDVDLMKVDWDAVADSGMYDGHAVSDLTMRYAYSHSMNHESFQFAEDSSGYGSIFRTWNAADGFVWNLDDYGADVSYWRLKNGFETVPIKLRERYVSAGGEMCYHHRLSSFDTVRLADGSEGVELHFEVGEEVLVVYARRLILAMPRRSLELLEKRGAVLGSKHQDVHKLIRSVVPIPLFKLVLCYRNRWWEDMGIKRGQSVTDLPLRQCYYWPVGGNTKAGAILIYNDGHGMDYWEGLRGHPDKFLNEPHLDGTQLPTEEWKQHPAPALMVKEAHRQLLAMHNATDTPERKPYAAAYRDWGDDPYGGGANFWRQHVKSREVSRRIVQPVSGIPVYICGEAYSHAQGWVEGALMTAEDLLQNHLGLAAPDFMPKTKPGHHLHGY